MNERRWLEKKVVILRRPKIYRKQKKGQAVCFVLKKVSRSRYIRIAMALGVPAREAQAMAETTRKCGLSYKEGLAPLMKAVLEVTDNPYVHLWIYMWFITGINP